MSFAASQRTRSLVPTSLVFLGCAILGGLAVLAPLAAVSAIAAAILIMVLAYCRRWIEPHQVFVLGALTAYIVLNYGFDNLGVRVAGIPLLAGHAMLLTGIVLAARKNPGTIGQVVREPAAKWLIVLATLTVFHLLVDAPKYGAMALRDASVIIESVFLVLGVLWGRDPQLTRVLIRWLPTLFLINVLYSFTFPLQLRLQALSQFPGVFQIVPLLGNYQLNMIYLLLGALYMLWLGGPLAHRSAWSRYGLAAAQLFGLIILQDRTMLVGMALILAFIMLIGEWRLSARILTPAGAAVAALVLVTVLGFSIPGRVGPVTSKFVKEYAGTLLEIGDRQREWGTDADRQKWFDQVWSDSTSSMSNFIWGRGFGEPLIDFRQRNGVPVRQPHNSTLSIFARLGLLGLIAWLCFLSVILKRFAVAILHRDRLGQPTATLVIWLFCLLIVNLLFTTVQPAFEFSHGAITFYFFVGFSLGFLRSQRERLSAPSAGVAHPVAMHPVYAAKGVAPQI